MTSEDGASQGQAGTISKVSCPRPCPCPCPSVAILQLQAPSAPMVRKHTVYSELQPGAPEPLAIPLVGHIAHNVPVSQPCRGHRALRSCEVGAQGPERLHHSFRPSHQELQKVLHQEAEKLGPNLIVWLDRSL